MSLVRSLFRMSTAFLGYYNTKLPPQKHPQDEIVSHVNNAVRPILSSPPFMDEHPGAGREIRCGVRIVRPSSSNEPVIIVTSTQPGVLHMRLLGPASSSSPDHHTHPERRGPFWLLSYGNLHMNSNMEVVYGDLSFPTGPSEPVVRKAHLLQPAQQQSPTPPPPPEPTPEKPKSSGTPGGWVNPAKARKLKIQKKKGKK